MPNPAGTFVRGPAEPSGDPETRRSNGSRYCRHRRVTLLHIHRVGEKLTEMDTEFLHGPSTEHANVTTVSGSCEGPKPGATVSEGQEGARPREGGFSGDENAGGVQ